MAQKNIYKFEQDELRVEETGYTLIPNDVIDGLDTPLTPAEFCLYVYLCSSDQNTSRAFPSRKKLAERMNCSLSTVDRTMRKLINIGLVEKIARYDPDDRTQLPNRYKVYYPNSADR